MSYLNGLISYIVIALSLVTKANGCNCDYCCSCVRCLCSRVAHDQFVFDFMSRLSNILIFLCLAFRAASYFKIFLLRHHNKTQTNQTSRNRTVSLNMASYRKTVYNALWIQLALVLCCILHFIVETLVSRVIIYGKRNARRTNTLDK